MTGVNESGDELSQNNKEIEKSFRVDRVRQIYLHQMGGFSVEAARDAFGLNQNQKPYSVIAVGYLGDPGTLTDTQREKEIGARLRRPLDEMLL